MIMFDLFIEEKDGVVSFSQECGLDEERCIDVNEIKISFDQIPIVINHLRKILKENRGENQ